MLVVAYSSKYLMLSTKSYQPFFQIALTNASHFETYIEYQKPIVIHRMLTRSLTMMFVNLSDDTQVH